MKRGCVQAPGEAGDRKGHPREACQGERGARGRRTARQAPVPGQEGDFCSQYGGRRGDGADLLPFLVPALSSSLGARRLALSSSLPQLLRGPPTGMQ